MFALEAHPLDGVETFTWIIIGCYARGLLNTAFERVASYTGKVLPKHIFALHSRDVAFVAGQMLSGRIFFHTVWISNLVLELLLWLVTCVADDVLFFDK